jgi:two-component system, NtrC family, sensor kinase
MVVVKPRVLVVDDEPLVLHALRRVLSVSHDVLTELSPVNALRRFDSGERWEFVVSDVMMPEMDGVEFVGHLLGKSNGVVSRVVLITGGALSPEHESWARQRNIPVLYKPLDIGVLRNLLAPTTAR